MIVHRYHLQRLSTGDDGTFGELFDRDDRLCLTCELPWRRNQAQISCIPAGIYTCVKHDSAKFPNTWELQDVPSREAILLHKGNTTRDTHGCILVGRTRGRINGDPAVLQSREAMDALRRILPDTFELEITEHYGE